MSRIYALLLYLAGRRTREEIKAAENGLKDAKKFVKSKEYGMLPDIRR